MSDYESDLAVVGHTNGHCPAEAVEGIKMEELP